MARFSPKNAFKRFNTRFETFVRSVSVPVGVLTVSSIAAAAAVPIIQVVSLIVNGFVAPNTALITIVGSQIVSVPILFYLFWTIRSLDRSRAKLSEARADMDMQCEELALARYDAEEANRSKSAFLAQMSHELRTPLNAVIGFSEMLSKQDEIGTEFSSRDVSQYAGMIHHSGEMLLSLVNDLLDLSKIEAGKLELGVDRFSVAEALDDARSCVSILAREKDVSLVLDRRFNDTEMLADRRALNQILLNLLSNAIKFSPMGAEVDVTISMDAQFLTFAVQDRGAGMTEADLSKAMEPFAQLGNAMVATQKGTGLGLPIVKSLIELEGGALRIVSASEKGTVAHVCYPLDKVVEQAAQRAAAS